MSVFSLNICIYATTQQTAKLDNKNKLDIFMADITCENINFEWPNNPLKMQL